MSSTTATPLSPVMRFTSATKSCGPVIDRMRRADFERAGAFRVAAAGDDHLQTEQFAEQDRHRADPAGAAVDQHRVAVGGKAALEQIDPHGEQGFGHRRGLGHAQHFGDDQAGARGRDAIFGIAAARDQGADLAARSGLRRPPRAATTVPAISSPRMSGRAGRRRIGSAALENVGPVDPGGRDLDQHFVPARAAAPGARRASALRDRRACWRLSTRMSCGMFGHWRQAY